jgi:hypothetical protein
MFSLTQHEHAHYLTILHDELLSIDLSWFLEHRLVDNLVVDIVGRIAICWFIPDHVFNNKSILCDAQQRDNFNELTMSTLYALQTC